MVQAEQLARQRGVSKARFLEIEELRVTEEQREAARKGRLVRWIPPLSLGRYHPATYNRDSSATYSR